MSTLAIVGIVVASIVGALVLFGAIVGTLAIVKRPREYVGDGKFE